MSTVCAGREQTLPANYIYTVHTRALPKKRGRLVKKIALSRLFDILEAGVEDTKERNGTATGHRDAVYGRVAVTKKWKRSILNSV